MLETLSRILNVDWFYVSEIQLTSMELFQILHQRKSTEHQDSLYKI